MNPALRRQVILRAASICEYCQMPACFDVLPFEIDHIVARKHQGVTSADNLALSCFSCNAYKGPNIAGIDEQTGEVTRLYHPRRDDWAVHFAWSGPVLLGRSAVGRVTIAVLDINEPDRIAVRQSLIEEGVFPP